MIRKCINISSKFFPESIKLFINRRFSMSEQRRPIQNFAFIDLETTGLPSMENNRTKITELSISIIESNHLRLGVFPRVRSKLNLCFNPSKFISPDATKLTGLSNDLLENQSVFCLDVVNTINDFLNLHKKPICFVAHNGNQFDYPILRSEICKVSSEFLGDVLCIDSLLCFKNLHEKQNLQVQSNITEPELSTTEIGPPLPKKAKVADEIPIEFTDEFDQLLCSAVDEYEDSNKVMNIQKKNETTPLKQIKSRKQLMLNTSRKLATTGGSRRPRISFKLEEIYKRLFSKNPENSHHAEGDVECMIHCAAKYGEDFITWANENARVFADIPPMRPGIKIIP